MFSVKSNSRFTSKATILEQMGEPRPLPMGMDEFETWFNRVFSGALLRHDHIPEKDLEEWKKDKRWAAALMILHLGPTESHKPDAYFIHSLRKAVANEIAHEVYKEKTTEIMKRKEAEARAAAELLEQEAKKATDDVKE